MDDFVDQDFDFAGMRMSQGGMKGGCDVQGLGFAIAFRVSDEG